MSSHVKLGINPIAWSNDDLPSLGAETSLESCLSDSRQAGFFGVELGNKFPRQARLLEPLLKKHQLALVSGWYSMRLLQRTVAEEIKAVQPHLQLLKALAANVMVCCEVSGAIHAQQHIGLSKRSVLSDNQDADFYKKVDEFAHYLEDNEVQMAYHHHMGTIIESEQDIDGLMENTKSMGLLLDTGHLVYADGDWRNIMNSWGNRINHVHCKDIRETVLKDVKNRDLSFLDAVLNGVFTVPGDGVIDYVEILKGLKKNDYQGWLVVEAEQDPIIAHPLTYATIGYQYLNQCLKQSKL